MGVPFGSKNWRLYSWTNWKKELLKENAIIVIESDRLIEVDQSEYQKVKDYKYGEIRVKIMWR